MVKSWGVWVKSLWEFLCTILAILCLKSCQKIKLNNAEAPGPWCCGRWAVEAPLGLSAPALSTVLTQVISQNAEPSSVRTGFAPSGFGRTQAGRAVIVGGRCLHVPVAAALPATGPEDFPPAGRPQVAGWPALCRAPTWLRLALQLSCERRLPGRV